ncbi:MAG TPA: type I-C CRISPR-associated endonuclease Cas1c [Polyangia bacterium]|jgi:CRISPR-associated protein Cas1|nr:type I-C CRISPR-associated endonuclease Cas1c [Polyangia bacterium]
MTAQAQNVLYVLSDGAYLSRDHDTVVVKVDGERRAQVPICQIEGVAVLARAGVSPELLGGLVDAGVFVSFFGYGGRLLARVDGIPGGNVLLRKAQVRASDNAAATLALARSFVIGKVASERGQVRRASRDGNGESAEVFGAAADRLAIFSRRALEADNLDELRGIEGGAAREYFQVFDRLLKTDEADLRFNGRSRRPPADPINAMLSFGYALLMRDCAAALAGVGLDPAIGFLHEDRPGRLGLALDVMEELRAPVVDRLVIALVNRRQIGAAHFRKFEGARWEMTHDGRRSFIAAYQAAKSDQIKHIFLEQNASWGLVPHLQARLLARTLRGDIIAYPPFQLK